MYKREVNTQVHRNYIIIKVISTTVHDTRSHVSFDTNSITRNEGVSSRYKIKRTIYVNAIPDTQGCTLADVLKEVRIVRDVSQSCSTHYRSTSMLSIEWYQPALPSRAGSIASNKIVSRNRCSLLVVQFEICINVTCYKLRKWLRNWEYCTELERGKRNAFCSLP